MSDDATNPAAEAAQKRLEKLCEELGEFFETVQVFCTVIEHNGTRSHAHGTGNWFARFGQVRTWLVKQEQHYAEDAKSERRENQ
jgi:hypothetical protein